jgi:hypothetical protein
MQATEETAWGSAETKPLRRLIVAWQDPSTRAYHTVGYLEVFDGPRFRFRYEPSITQELESFQPFPNFPETSYEYESPELFPFFSNRVMSPKRPEYPSIVSALALGNDVTPIELLARSGGERATDTIQVFAIPEPDDHGVVSLVFPAHGVRHIRGAEERIQDLAAGAVLEFRDDPANEYNPHALLIVAGEPVGWVPDFLLGMVRKLVSTYVPYQLTVEAASGPEVPYHFRLLCRLDVQGASDWDPDSV